MHGENITDALRRHAEDGPREQIGFTKNLRPIPPVAVLAAGIKLSADDAHDLYDRLEESLMRDRIGRCRESKPPPKPRATT